MDTMRGGATRDKKATTRRPQKSCHKGSATTRCRKEVAMRGNAIIKVKVTRKVPQERVPRVRHHKEKYRKEIQNPK